MIRPLLCLIAMSLAAQEQTAPKSTPEAPKLPPRSSSPIKELVRADLSPAETGTPEALTASLYTFISGPKDQKRDIEKIRALFHLSARVLWVGNHPKEGTFFRMIELEPFLKFALPQWEQGFFEQSTSVIVQKWEGMAQVWSPFTIRKTPEGPVEFTGVNALQCAWDGKRWWITHLEFQNQAAQAIPAAAPEAKPKPKP